MTNPVETLIYLGKYYKKLLSVFVVPIDCFAIISSAGYVIDCSVVLYSQWACHVVFYATLLGLSRVKT